MISEAPTEWMVGDDVAYDGKVHRIAEIHRYYNPRWPTEPPMTVVLCEDGWSALLNEEEVSIIGVER